MLRSEAARYARWSAGVALLLAGITAGVYLQHGWIARRIRKSAPPPAPASVERQLQGLTFSKVEGDRTLFTVRASSSTVYKNNGENVLDDVQITIFGRRGERHDLIHTQSCQYESASGRIACTGDVVMDMQSAADAERKPGGAQGGLHVETRNVTFDRQSGIAETDRAVRFRFANGEGSAVGLSYDSNAGVVRLGREIWLKLRQVRSNDGAAEGHEVEVRGTSLEYGRNSRAMRLLGPAVAETQREKLNAGLFELMLDEKYQAESLTASAGNSGAQPELRAQETQGESRLLADVFVAHFASAGWVEQIEGSGSVHGALQGSREHDEIAADKLELSLWPGVERARELTLQGNVSLRTEMAKTGETRALQTSALRVLFSGEKEKEANRPVRAETLAAASVDWTERAAVGTGQGAQSRLSAEQMALSFSPDGKAQRVEAIGSVQMQRQAPGHAVQTATGNSGSAVLAANGGWAQVELHGTVRISEGERRGQADRASLRRAEQTAELTGHASVRDASMITQAERITFLPGMWNLRAEGAVGSTELPGGRDAVNLSAEPANLTADALALSSQLGRAEYKGHARLWQGSSVLEAETITLLQATRTLLAAGGVRAAFSEAELSAVGESRGLTPATKKNGRSVLWHVQAGTLMYGDAEGRAHLEKDVVAATEEESMRAPVPDLYFTRGGANQGQQISRAAGSGGVTIEQGERRGTAERGEYTAAEGKFVMAGGSPALYDGDRGTTTGRQLTFFLADDTIIVDSENGSRTLTKHRVER